MPISPSSAAQAAREAVAARLRELRVDAGLSGGELGRRCEWTHSKSSRIENARTPPTPDDIRRWCAACGAADQAAELVARSQTAETQYVDWRRKMRVGLRQLQHSYDPLFQATRLFRVYSATAVPGLLQSEGYTRGVLSSITRFREIPDEVDGAVAARMARSNILRDPKRRFVMVVEEAALYYQMADGEAMAAQLGHLMTVGAMPTVSFGIIPAAFPQRPKGPAETFHMYDDSVVSVELTSAVITLTQPNEIALYDRAFAEYQGMAVYGAEARALIVSALQALR
ncbi:helix-turn-helix domain-containing protein (plasmid) [Streptomyces sp. BI20]|uniref:helix-turn-helix domain-containing protein n=1 Tax=Streptomyces sp. BI20 TaxID=3403460 RepID=UPI003C72F910